MRKEIRLFKIIFSKILYYFYVEESILLMCFRKYIIKFKKTVKRISF